MNHEINLTGYTATCGEPNNMLDLGTAGSYGLEKLHVTADAAWNGLTITATFTNSGSTTVAVSDGAVDVPPEATRLPTRDLPPRDRMRYGMLAFKGVDANGKLRIISTPIYYKVQASAATDGSNTIDPTPDQYAQFVAEVTAEADRAEAAADRAESAGSTVTPEQIAEAVNNYLTENPVQATTIDATLTQSGQAADAKAVGDALGNLSEEIANKSGADYTFLNGLKYYACGDSIVDIQGTLTAPETFGDSGYTSDLQSRNITDITVEGYVTAIEQRYGLVATNCGNSGHTLVQDYASLAAKDYSDVALVTIAYGCNDARTNVPLGTVNSTDVTTFAGALNQLLRKIYTDNPECRVIVLTPIQRLYVSEFGIGTANSNGNYLVDFADMCKKVAAKRSTKCIDMYRDCGINQTNLYYYTVEGVHPVNQGFARMKGAIIPVLDDMFALEYEPFGTMTNTGDTEPDEPDTGGDSGGDTPPEEEPGATVVDLSGLFVLAGQYFDPYESFQNNTKLLGIDHPGVALEGGHTYTLITYLPCSADTTWAYGGALANNPSMNPHGGDTLSFGKAVGTFEVITINGNYYGKCSYTFTIAAGSTKYLYTSRAADLDDSYVSLTYI